MEEERLYTEGLIKQHEEELEEYIHGPGCLRRSAQAHEIEMGRDHGACQPDFCMHGQDQACPEAEVFFDERD